MAESKPEPSISKSKPEEDAPRAPNVLERAKEEMEAIAHHHSGKSPVHDKETHGRNDDIDEDTPVDEVKGPGVFERVKEEVEAIVGSVIHHKKKDSNDDSH
ncbi:hypothetical protein Tsubulata_028729 [Turnera subulata]|uniref:Uncharacterized protein n=1 Tax=Turnera subulata TaxID=218843 RepID=A0A9Q0GKL8_9ROSI|nr:hypothetical protein Tsubulata_028729 [Turnera subulata]